MIYTPYNVFPNNGTTIDATKENEFKFIFVGSKCLGISLTIEDAYSFNKVYSKWYSLDKTYYNNDEITLTIPINNKMINGNDYQWYMTLNESDKEPNIFVVGNIIRKVVSNTQFQIEPSILLKDFNFGLYLMINGEIRQITNYTEDGTNGIVTVKSAFSNTINKDQQYSVYKYWITTPRYYFKARSNSQLNIKGFSSPINSRKYTFEGEYSQKELIPVKYQIWNLYSREDKELLDTTGKIYSGNLRYSFDGFINNDEYFIELVTENQEGLVNRTMLNPFRVEYRQPDFKVRPYPHVENKPARINITWKEDRFSKGVPSGDCEYEFVENFPFEGTNSLNIRRGTIQFDETGARELEIEDKQFTVFTSVCLDDNKEGKIIELAGDNILSYFVDFFGYAFYYNLNNKNTFICFAYKYGNEWVLKTNPPKTETGYVWDDMQTWNDTIDGNEQFWTEPVTLLSSKQYKITMLPYKTDVKEVKAGVAV